MQHVGIALDEALRMASTYPARLLGENCRLGKIETGYRPSFVTFDKELSSCEVIEFN